MSDTCLTPIEMIKIKTEQEIKIMAEGGRILADVMRNLQKMVKPGISTEDLDKAAEGLVFKYGAKLSFKGYQNFPAGLCSSINQEIVHCVPSNRVLKQGDIVSLDLGILYKGFHTDMAVTLGVGEIAPEAARLIKITKKALKRGIKKTRAGNTFGDIGNTIQRFAESQGYQVVRELCGHGIGRAIHEDPQIPNYGKRRKGQKIKSGMVFCIEPMLTAGHWKLQKLTDGFGYQTKDQSLSAHFEHTVAITEKGAQVLTELR